MNTRAFLRAVATVGLVCSASGAVAQASAPLTTADLLAAAARYENPRADKFSPRPSEDDIIGRRFRAEVRFPELINEGGPQIGRTGGWQYDADRQQLRLVPWTQFVVGDELRSDPNLKGVETSFIGFSMRTNGHFVGRTVEGNALGATISVDQYMGTTLIVAAMSHLAAEPPFPGVGAAKFETRLPMSAADARSTTPHLALFVEGTVVPYAERQAIACGDTIAPATFEHHAENLLHECVISSRIDRFGIEDDRSGKVLAEWSAATTAAAAGSGPDVLAAIPEPIRVTAARNAVAAAARGGMGISFFPTPYGVLVMAVAPGSPAAAAGLKPGQVVQGVNGKALAALAPADAIKAVQADTPVVSFTMVDGSELKLTRPTSP